MEIKLTNPDQFEPIQCQSRGDSFEGTSLYSTASIKMQGPRSFPSIEGNDRGPGLEMKSVKHPIPIDCQLTNSDPFEPIQCK